MAICVHAEPQASAALTVGGAAIGVEGHVFGDAAFHFGARGDVLFGRDRGADVGYGPYLDVATLDFDRLSFGGGASLLAPVHEDLPLVLSLGGFATVDELSTRPGVAGAIFWGSRSYNFHSNYGMAAGLLLTARQGLTAPHESSLIVAAQIDVVALSLPFVAFAHWLAGPTASGE
jgi:hypothetical protein